MPTASSAVRAGARPLGHRRVPALAGPLGTAAVLGGLTAVVALRSPHVSGSYGVCPSLALFGVWCPGCGGLRATHDLATGDLAGAWSMNAAFVLLLPLLAGAWLVWLYRAAGRRPPALLARAVTAPAVPWGVLALVLVFGVLRNVPVVSPWLAPGGVLAPAFAG